VSQWCELDVSTLEPCEPMEQVLAAVTQLKGGDVLHVYHRMPPTPLFPLLQQQHFTWHMCTGRQHPIEIFIWQEADKQAAEAVTNYLAEYQL